MTTRITAETQPQTRLPATPDDDAALRRIRAVNPKADPAAHVPGVPPSRIPRHIAVIMDGNGRWAQQRGLPRAAGHQAGARAARDFVEHAGLCGVEAVTLFSFSSENWKRPRDEIDALMALYLHSIRAERASLIENNIRFRQIGRRDGLPPEVLAAIEDAERATRDNTGCTLCLAVNYGSRAEIVDAARSLARDAAAGTLDPERIDEGLLASRLNTAGLPDPDLLIRTAGEMRVSNYLLWQISYAELHVTQKFWPDFGPADLVHAIRDYAGRSRRFGGLQG